VPVSGEATLEASNRIGAAVLGSCAALTAGALALSATAHWAAWLAGQALLAVALVQWFILLHEAGHLTLFRNRGANLCVGHLAGCLALIPFESWRRVHGLHHLWTGWQDLDPTTASLVPRPLGRAERLVVDWAWRLWLPLFSVVYRISNYWHLPRLYRLFADARARRAMLANAVLLAVLYASLAWLLGAEALLRLFGLGVLLSLALQDPLILSQHTHLPQPVSGGRAVSPLKPSEQQRYTRSLRFPSWVASCVLFHFDAHERHHAHAGVPGYRLARIAEPQRNEVHWWTWLRQAKRLPGSVFLFSNSERTGFRL
jgi:omega-6 fatty acid desaturase (delta-12 desaturase)